MNNYKVLKEGDRYTIGEYDEGYKAYIVNDGICCYYFWDTFEEAQEAADALNACEITHYLDQHGYGNDYIEEYDIDDYDPEFVELYRLFHAVREVTYKYEVLEDNGGGLYLFVFDRYDDSDVIYAHANYERSPGELLEGIEELKDGVDVSLWSGCADNPLEMYDNFTPETGGTGWKLVADEKGLYPDNMGVAARIEFGVE